MSRGGTTGKQHVHSGYTIVEVMIFIAVSAFIFLAAITAIGGRQQQVQFSQSVREFESRIADVINDVTTGFYPTNGSISCNVTAADITISASATPIEIGSNESCLYVGKALQFSPVEGVVSTGTAGDPTKMWIYNLAGRKFTQAGITTVKTIDEATPAAVAFTNPPLGVSDSVEEVTLRYGVRVTRVFEQLSPSLQETYGFVGVLSSFEGSNITSPVSSSQSVQIGGIRSNTVKFDANKSSAIGLINNLTEDSTQPEGYINTNSSGIVICLEGDDQRKASVTIGASGDSTVLLQIDDYNIGCDETI